MLKSIILSLLLCICLVHAQTCELETIFTGELDPSDLNKFQITFSSADYIIVPYINPTPSTTGKIEVTVSTCADVNMDPSAMKADLANGVQSSLLTLGSSTQTITTPPTTATPVTTTSSPKGQAKPSSGVRMSAPLPFLTIAFAVMFIFPKSRISALAVFAALCFAAYTPLAHAGKAPITIYVNITLPPCVTFICYNDLCQYTPAGLHSTDAPTPTTGSGSGSGSGSSGSGSGSGSGSNPTSSPTVMSPTPSATNPTGTTTYSTNAPTPAYCFNLRVLVLADKQWEAKNNWGDGGEIPDSLGADWANRTFMSVGMPYDFYPTASDLTALLSTSGSCGQYSGIVYVKATTFVIPAAQMTLINNYNLKYNTKLVVVGSTPASCAGMASAGAATNAAGKLYVAQGFTQYAKTMQSGVQVDVSIINNWQTGQHTVQPGTVTDSTIATAAIMFQPATGNAVVAAAVIQVGGTQQLHYFVQQCTTNLFSYSMAPLMLNWLSPGGVFQGKRRLTLSVQPDDLFLSAYLWDTVKHQDSTSAYNPPLEYRISGTDLQYCADWLDAKNAELGGQNYISIEWPFNGLGSNSGQQPAPTAYFDARFAGTDLFNVTMKVYEKFWFISHTWDHPCPQFDTESFDYINQEWSYNNIWASNSFLPGGLDNPRMSKNCAVSPCITGLHNPNFWQANLNNGIHFHVGDNSEPYLSSPRNNPYHGNYTTVADNGVVGGFIIPREVYAIDVGNSVPAEYTDQWNKQNKQNVDFETAMVNPIIQGVFDLIAYRQDPHMFHEASVRDFVYADPKKGNIHVSLVTLWMDRVIDTIRTYFDLPIVSPKYSDLANTWVNRMEMDACGFNAQTLIDVNNNIIGFTVSSQQTCTVHITGVTFAACSTVTMETYGSDTTAYISMTAGVSQTLYLSTPVSL